MANVKLGNSPAGVIEKVDNLQDRTKAIYWRPYKHEDGSIEWMPTLPLPADAQGREQYLAKGFKLSDPSKEPSEASTDAENEALKAEIAALKAQLADSTSGIKETTLPQAVVPHTRKARK